MSSRWREENYFRYARTRFALDALDSYAAAPDDPRPDGAQPGEEDRRRPGQGRRAALAAGRRSRPRRHAARAAQPRPRPGRPTSPTRPSTPSTPRSRPPSASSTKPSTPPRPSRPAIRLGDLAPDMVRLDTEAKQITHAIRMAAYNAETTLARALNGHYARAEDEAYALIREALTTSGDIIPGHGELLIRLDPLTAPRRTQALAALCDQLNPGPAPATPEPISSCATKSNPTPALHDLSPYVRSPGKLAPSAPEASQRSCHVWPGWLPSQSSIRVRPRRRCAWPARLPRANGAASSRGSTCSRDCLAAGWPLPAGRGGNSRITSAASGAVARPGKGASTSDPAGAWPRAITWHPRTRSSAIPAGSRTAERPGHHLPASPAALPGGHGRRPRWAITSPGSGITYF